MTNESSLLSDFLEQLGVPHTRSYSDERFKSMPFPTLFGLQKLLAEYGVESQGIRVDNTAGITQLSVPFLAKTVGGFVIVTACTEAEINYISFGEPEQMAFDEFTKVWGGIAFLAFPKPDACEPEYGEHRRIEIVNSSKQWVLLAIAITLFAYLFISNGLWRRWSDWAIAAIDLGGLYITWLLLQKTLNIKSKAADSVCGVIEAGGCDNVLKTPASKFFGIFSWSEVGFTYFSVSLICLLVFPQYTPYLAAINVCCLPYSFWSVWYQKFRAKSWCTLCLTVQASLWSLFACYLLGGWFNGIFPLKIEFFDLGATYIGVLLALNRIMPNFENKEP